MRVVVAIATYRRNDMLREMLPAVLREVDLLLAETGICASVLVVDNDPEGGAAHVTVDFPAVRYVLEIRAGIAAARQRALDEAVNSDLLAFIDDDEYPARGWLQRLVRTQIQTSAAAVTGPVVRDFSPGTPEWITESKVFLREDFESGSHRPQAATGNLLVDLSALRAMNLGFDTSFDVTGGEDWMFTRSIVARGGMIVWCNEAIAHERVETARLTRRWIRMRAYSLGNSESQTRLPLRRTRWQRLLTRIHCVVFGLLAVAGGALQSLAGGVRRDVTARANGTFDVMWGLGQVTGAFGWRYREYRRPRAGRRCAHNRMPSSRCRG